MFLARTSNLTTKQTIIGIVVMFVVIFIYVTIREKINTKKANTGEDKRKLVSLLQKAVPEYQSCTLAYGSWEWKTYQGRRTTTKYWYYGVAFNDEALYVVPLSCDGGDLSYSNTYIVKKEDIGIVNSKKGENWMELYDRNQKEILSVMVDAKSLNEDKFHPVNIIQEEESKKFVQWKDKWMDEINSARGVNATGKMKRPVK